MEKTFVGNTSDKTFQDGNAIIRLGLNIDKVQHHIKNGWLNVCIAKKKVPKGDGKDWYCYIDNYQPKQEQSIDVDEPIVENIPF